MRWYLIRAFSGVILLFMSMVLLSTRHYGMHGETDVFQKHAGGTPSRWAQQEMTLMGVMDHGSHTERENKSILDHAAHSTVGRGLLLEDLFIAVKTTHKFHQSRMGLLLDTWISRLKEQTHVFTDKEDDELQEKLGDHVIVTNCSAEHSHPALSCKMAAEFDAFLASGLSWFCHLDDDNYLNPQALLNLLTSYSPDKDVYIGKPSLNRPIHASETLPNNQTKSVYFWFATGGAGFCISRKLATKMAPWARAYRFRRCLMCRQTGVQRDQNEFFQFTCEEQRVFESGEPQPLTAWRFFTFRATTNGINFLITSELIHLPDDCTVGYIIECKLASRLVPSILFHSHLENLHLIQNPQLTQQVTLSYGIFEKKLNTIKLAGPFSSQEDPSRFRSLHCLLYPDTSWCPQSAS